MTSTTDIDTLLLSMIDSGEGISDLLFVTDRPPQVEAHGRLVPFHPDAALLTAEGVESLAHGIMAGRERLHADLEKFGACDCSYALGTTARFRVNIYRQNGNLAMVLRKLQSQIPQIDKLGLPPVFRAMIQEKTGLVFVTGGTGSGKTTTLAAMLNELNQTEPIHVVTLEDPIEFMHPHAAATFSQRELGRDFQDFASGLKAALRQAPKVIFVGEIRDRETMEIALTAAETGHVVFSTLHTISAGQTINRVLGMFSQEEEAQIRIRLADTLRYVVSQRLVRKKSGSRMLMTEVMGSSMRTRETILLGESDLRNYQEIIEAGGTMGWHSLDQSLARAFQEEHIDEETALLFSNAKSRMRQELDRIKKLTRPVEDAPTGLKLRMPEPPPLPAQMAPRMPVAA